jgi:hypothetical protein
MNTINYGGTDYNRDALFNLKGKDLVALHNKLAKKAKVPETKRFSTIGAGIDRTWKLLEQFGTPVEKAKPASKLGAEPTNGFGSAVAAKGGKAGKVKVTQKKAAPAEKAPAARRGTNLAAPGFAPLACREGSKQAILLDKLSGSKGATMDELIEALSGGNKPWTEATVRSGFGWDMKQKGYGVRSEFDDKGVERFFIVLPAGFARPAHTPLKSAKPKAHAQQGRLTV